jgi:hypothetical protein
MQFELRMELVRVGTFTLLGGSSASITPRSLTPTPLDTDDVSENRQLKKMSGVLMHVSRPDSTLLGFPAYARQGQAAQNCSYVIAHWVCDVCAGEGSNVRVIGRNALLNELGWLFFLPCSGVVQLCGP